MNRALRILGSLALPALVLVSCNKELSEELTGSRMVSPNLPENPFNYYPNHPDSSLNHRATLGRVLFYETQLSANNSVSCGSCHKQQFGFADNVQFSRGLNNERTGRNSMAIVNLPSNGFLFQDGLGPNPGFLPVMNTKLFWDGRENNLRNLVGRPINNHVEMGIDDLSSLIPRVEALPYYDKLFKQAYGDETVSLDRLSDAIAVFMESIQSSNTKFDQSNLVMGVGTPLSGREQRGYDLFFGQYNCGSCHNPFPGPYMVETARSIGLDANPSDLGAGAVSRNALDNGKFKVPSLRNVELTSPYMHDGRFKTLDEVLEHYSEGIKEDPNLDEVLRNADGTPRKMNIPPADREALIAYLKTLTDWKMISDTKFADPFLAQ
jgi:cytochrome c peroxidase